MKYCQKLLKIDSTNEEASFMLANSMLIKGQADGAIDTFKCLLEKDPENYRALS